MRLDLRLEIEGTACQPAFSSVETGRWKTLRLQVPGSHIYVMSPLGKIRFHPFHLSSILADFTHQDIAVFGIIMTNRQI
jgi:hypothetical protein